MTSEQKRQVNKELYNYQAYKGKVKDAREDAFYGGLTIDYSNIRVNSSVGNTAENRVIKALSDSELMLLWIRVFECTLIKYTGEYKDRLMRMKYIDQCSRRQICGKLHIGTATYHRWLDEILETAYMWSRNLKVL